MSTYHNIKFQTPLRWWYGFALRYQDGFKGKREYHLLSQIKFTNSAPINWFSNQYPWYNVIEKDGFIVEIILNNSVIRFLPASFGQLMSLKEINICDNQLIQLPILSNSFKVWSFFILYSRCYEYIYDEYIILVYYGDFTSSTHPNDAGCLHYMDSISITFSQFSTLPDSVLESTILFADKYMDMIKQSRKTYNKVSGMISIDDLSECHYKLISRTILIDAKKN